MSENPKPVKIETDPVLIYINEAKILLEKLKQAELRFEESVVRAYENIQKRPIS